MYRAPSKRRQLIQRTIVYSTMTMVVISLVTIAVLLMLGFRFNKNSNEFQQGGLVQFTSRPSGARIKIGQANLTDVTSTKITVNPGDYPVTMNRDGYQPWQKDVTVHAGSILWLNYAQLVPNELQTTQVESYKDLDAAVTSPNGQYVALLPDDRTLAFTMLKIDNQTTEASAVALPDNLMKSVASSRFSIVSWSSDSERFLVKQRTKKSVDWYMIDRRHPEESVNLTRDYDIGFTEAQFDPRSSHRLFIRTASGDVRLLDEGKKSLSAVLVRQVAQMSLFDDRALLYVQKDSVDKLAIGYLSLSAATGRKLTSVPVGAVAKIAADTYFGDIYLAVASDKTVVAYKLDGLPQSDGDVPISMAQTTTNALPGSVTHLSIRSGGRFIVAQSRTAVSNYDVELNKFVTTNLGIAVTDELQWLDRYHLYYVQKNKLQVMEFDGANRHSIASAAKQFDAVQTSDAKFIYSFHVTDEGVSLQRTRMILN